MWKLQLPRASRSKSRGYRAAKSIAADRKAVARREEAQHTARVRAERNAEEAFYCWNNANTHTSQAEIHFHRVRMGSRRSAQMFCYLPEFTVNIRSGKGSDASGGRFWEILESYGKLLGVCSVARARERKREESEAE